MNQAMSLAYPFRGGPVPKELRSNLHSDSCFPAEYLKPHTLASAGLGSVSQCQISSYPLSRVPVPGNLQGFEVPDSSAFHSNPRGRGKRWEEAVGMTPRADSYNLVSVCFSSTRIYLVRIPGFKICRAAFAMKRATIKGSLMFGVLIPFRTTSNRYRT